MMELNSISSFGQHLLNEETCLHAIFLQKYKNIQSCSKCSKPFLYYKVKGRKCYECGKCGHQLYPMKDTIFEGSRTSLTIWFEVIKDFAFNKAGLSANSIVIKYDLTIKTAISMLRKIRQSMGIALDDVLSGTIEIDETYIGGRRKLIKGTSRKGIGDKQIVFGLLERKRAVRMFVVKNKNAQTIRVLINGSVAKGSIIHHDNNGTYGDLKAAGYIPKLVRSKKDRSFCKDGVHNNNIETLWSRFKRHMLSTYCSCNPKYLQDYLNEFCFRYKYPPKAVKANFPAIFWKIACPG